MNGKASFDHWHLVLKKKKVYCSIVLMKKQISSSNYFALNNAHVSKLSSTLALPVNLKQRCKYNSTLDSVSVFKLSPELLGRAATSCTTSSIIFLLLLTEILINCNYHIPFFMSFINIPVSLSHLFKGIFFINHRFDFSGFDQFPEKVKIFCSFFWRS